MQYLLANRAEGKTKTLSFLAKFNKDVIVLVPNKQMVTIVVGYGVPKDQVMTAFEFKHKINNPSTKPLFENRKIYIDELGLCLKDLLGIEVEMVSDTPVDLNVSKNLLINMTEMYNPNK